MDHRYYMKMAIEEAQNALLRGEFPVGCVLVHQGSVIATGARTGTAGTGVNEVDHAEITALRRLSEMTPKIDPKEIILYCTMEPCLMCFAALMLTGIRTVVYAYEDVMGGGTDCPLTELRPLYIERQINVVPHVLREESLALFKRFFKDPKNHYWQGSLLERYTLESR